MQRPRIRLIDVAERAGVSRATASFVLNGRHAELRISDAARERVERAARELDYRPNLAARLLRTNTSHTIGIVSDTVATEPFAGELIRGALAVGQEHGRLLLIGETEGATWVQRDVVCDMLDRRVDALVFATMFTREIELPPAAHQVPTVLLNCTDAAGSAPSVVPDEVQAGRAAARVLLEAGHGNGIHLVGERPRAVFAARERCRGIRAELKASGGRLAGAVDCDWSEPSGGYAAVRKLLTTTHPSALICLNDRIAFGAYQALHEAGLRVPDDVSVVSFDGSDLASWLRPRLASVALPHHEMGRRAVELLVKGEVDPAVYRVPMPLHPGGSVAGPASATGSLQAPGHRDPVR